MRAFTAKDKKAVKAIAEIFRENPRIETEKVITELGIGEALASVLDASGTPTRVVRVLVRPPYSQMGPIPDIERNAIMTMSPFADKYKETIDRESAYEMLKKKAEKSKASQAAAQAASTSKTQTTRQRQGSLETFAKSMARSVGRSVGQKIIRGILGTIMK